MEIKINIIAVLVAVVVNFVLGFIWYTPLFGKIWRKEMGYDPNMRPEKSAMFKGNTGYHLTSLLVVALILTFWT